MAREALRDDAWNGKIDTSHGFTIEHIFEYVDLRTLLSHVQLHEEIEDDITWRLSMNREHSAAAACKVQFMGAMLTTMSKIVWKVCLPPPSQG